MGRTRVLAVLIVAAALAISPAQGRGDDATGTLAIWVGQWLMVSAEYSGFCDRSGFLERARNKHKGYLHMEGLVEPPDQLPWLEGRI